MRLVILFVVLAGLVLVSFFLFEKNIMSSFTQEGTIQWLLQYNTWAWLAGIALLVGDLFLPLPATLIMSALGYLYGPLTGGLVSVLGSFLSGSLGYWLCRLMGKRTALRLLGQRDYERGIRLSSRVGGWLVALSRWLPVFPEVIACMAGLVRMQPLVFHLALICGAIPLGFGFAYLGHSGIDNPTLALTLSALVPPVLWLVSRMLIRKLST